MKINVKKIVFWVFVFIYIMFLIYMLPMTGDDWGKGAANLFDSLKDAISLWKSYNGRFLGNTLVNLMKYNIYFKCIFSSLILTSMFYFASKINSKKMTIF